MAKFGRYNVNMRKGASFMSIIMKTVKFVLLMYVGGLILIRIASVLNLATTPFLSAFNLLGYTDAGSGAATLGTTGLISIVGILGGVYLVMQFVNVKRV